MNGYTLEIVSFDSKVPILKTSLVQSVKISANERSNNLSTVIHNNADANNNNELTTDSSLASTEISVIDNEKLPTVVQEVIRKMNNPTQLVNDASLYHQEMTCSSSSNATLKSYFISGMIPSSEEDLSVNCNKKKNNVNDNDIHVSDEKSRTIAAANTIDTNINKTAKDCQMTVDCCYIQLIQSKLIIIRNWDTTSSRSAIKESETTTNSFFNWNPFKSSLFSRWQHIHGAPNTPQHNQQKQQSSSLHHSLASCSSSNNPKKEDLNKLNNPSSKTKVSKSASSKPLPPIVSRQEDQSSIDIKDLICSLDLPGKKFMAFIDQLTITISEPQSMSPPFAARTIVNPLIMKTGENKIEKDTQSDTLGPLLTIKFFQTDSAVFHEWVKLLIHATTTISNKQGKNELKEGNKNQQDEFLLVNASIQNRIHPSTSYSSDLTATTDISISKNNNISNIENMVTKNSTSSWKPFRKLKRLPGFRKKSSQEVQQVKLKRKVTLVKKSFEDPVHIFHEGVPDALYRCICMIERIGLETEGLYRVSGNLGTVQSLVSAFKKDPAKVLLRPPPPSSHVLETLQSPFLPDKRASLRLKQSRLSLDEESISFSYGKNTENSHISLATKNTSPFFPWKLGHAAAGWMSSIQNNTNGINNNSNSKEPKHKKQSSATSVTSFSFVSSYDNDVHVLTGVVKQYLRDKENEPLIPENMYSLILSTIDIHDKQERLISLQDLIHALPPNQFSSLRFLTKHLAKVASHASTNKMSIKNLSIVFGPSLLRIPSEEDSLLKAMSDMPKQCLAVEHLIEYVDFLFGPIEYEAVDAQGKPQVCARVSTHTIHTSFSKSSSHSSPTKSFDKRNSSGNRIDSMGSLYSITNSLTIAWTAGAQQRRQQRKRAVVAGSVRPNDVQRTHDQHLSSDEMKTSLFNTDSIAYYSSDQRVSHHSLDIQYSLKELDVDRRSLHSQITLHSNF